MKRRRALLAGGGLLSQLLAGCTTTGSETTARQTQSPTPTSATTDETPSETKAGIDSYRSAFMAFLAASSAEVDTLTVDKDANVVTLRYITDQTGYEDIGAEVGTIAGGYFRQISNGWSMDRLNATILTPNADPTATWHAETAWFEAYQDGEIEAEDLSFRVLDTLEPIRTSTEK